MSSIKEIPQSFGILRYKHTDKLNTQYYFRTSCHAGTVQSVEQLATGWTVRGLNPGGGEIFRTRPDRAWGPPSLLQNGLRVFPGGKAAEAWR